MRIVCFSVSSIDSERFIWIGAIYVKVTGEPENKAWTWYTQIFM